MFKKTIFDLQKQPANCEDLIEESLKEIQRLRYATARFDW